MKTLIFDCGGVLAYPRLGEWNLPLRLAEILGARAKDIHTAKYLMAHRACIDWLDESRLVPDVEAERRLRRAYARDMNQRMGWRLTPAETDAIGDDFTDNLDRYAFFGGVNDWLEHWKRSYRLGLLSDAMPSMLEALKRQGLFDLFEVAIISTHVGAIKPDPRMFDAALRALGEPPEDCLFIDDRPCNVEGALAAGMRAVQMAHPGFPPEAIWPGRVARGFDSLDRMLVDGAVWRQE